jgi:hypothetical protein
MVAAFTAVATKENNSFPSVTTATFCKVTSDIKN